MATRVNTKFVLVVSATLFAAGGVVFGLWVLHVRGDTTRHIRAGDELMAMGDYEHAFKEYGRAVSKEPANLSHLQKVEDALLRIRPTGRDQANELDGMRVEILRHRTRYRPQDPDVHLELLDELHQRARWFDSSDTWRQVESVADEMWTRVPAGDPKRPYAKLYRGMARTRLLSPRTATPEEIDEAQQDLLDFIQDVPGSDMGWATLVAGQLSVARQLKTDGNTRRAEESARKVADTLQQALEAVPDGVEVARIHAYYLSQQRAAGDTTVTDEEAEQAIDRMVELVKPSDDPMLLSEISSLVRSMDRKNGVARAIDMLREYLEANPDMLYQRYTLAVLYFHNQELDKAYETAEAVIQAEPVPVGMLSKLQHVLQLRAAGLIADTEYLRWETADEKDKPQRLTGVEVARDRIAELVGDDQNEPLLLRADGKIAIAKGDFATAADKFERIVQLQPLTDDYETLWNAARALEQIGQLGLSLERMRGAAALQPRNPRLLAEQARLEYRVGRYEDARRTIAAVQQLAPDNDLAGRLLTAIEAGPGDPLVPTGDPVAKALAAAETATAEGDLDTARSLLTEALAQEPASLVLLGELVRTEMRAGQTDAARVYLDKALALAPDNQYLRKVDASLSTRDQVEALKNYMADVYEDETERVVHSMIHLRRLAMEMDKLVEQDTADGDADAAAEAAGNAARARTEADLMEVRARELDPSHPALIEHLFKNALVADDWATARAMIDLATANNADQADGLIFKGRYELAREDLDAAVLTLTEATARKHYSALAWRLLGRAQERLGNFPDALRAYEQAYDCNPNDKYAVRWYVNLLVQTGDQIRALRILRSARHALGSDTLLREVRLQLEADVGDLRRAISERREIYQSNGPNRLNAIRLAALLGRTQPTYEHVLDGQGQRMYDADSWRILPQSQRQQMLDAVSAKWVAESEKIMTALAAEGEDSLELASVRADLLRMRGEVERGESVLVDFAGRFEDGKSVEAYVALGQYQATVNQLDDAVQTLQTAQEVQDPASRQADRALGDLYFNQAVWQPAYDIYRSLYDAGLMEDFELRLVECCTKLQRFEEGQEILNKVVAKRGPTFLTNMLEAAIAQGQGDKLYAENRTAEAQAKYDLEMGALDRAEQLNPSSPMPHVRRAQRLVRQFDQTNNRTYLDDSLRALERADEVQAGAEATSVMRVEILRKLGDVRAAMGELTRLLNEAPDNAAARRLLVQLNVESGNQQAALQLVAEAIRRNPTVALWREMKGDLHAVRREIPAAAESFAAAYRLQPTKARLAKLAETSLAVETPDYEKVIALMAGAGEQLQDNPLARGLYARALIGAEQPDAAIEQMRIAHDEHLAMIKEQPASRVALVTWYRTLQTVFQDKTPGELEAFVREVTDDKPDALDMQWMARSWVVMRPDDGIYRAIELSRIALEQFPDEDPTLRVQLFMDLGQFQVQTQDYQSAVKSFEGAIAIDPKQALALNNAAYLYAEELDDPAAAIPYAERAAEVLPNDPFILDTLGWTLFKAGRLDRAEEPLRRAIEISPSAENHLHLASVLARTDRAQKAEIYLRRAAELRPSDETLAEILRLAEEININVSRSSNP